ncbi:hypothetical protein NMG60_11003987 [Bertholletia excelsa]
MAVRCYAFPSLITHKSLPIRKPTKVFMAMDRQISVEKAPAVQIRFSPRNKVFEDQSEGIVCYRDENGEITCEGYDEGPRLQEPGPIMDYHARDAEIIDILQKNWLQIAKESDLSFIDKDDARCKDFNRDGFKTFYQ